MIEPIPKYVLLTGAGFSRNWGGWLAAEAFDYLLGAPEIDDGLRQILWRHQSGEGFEAALGEIQDRYANQRDRISEKQLTAMQNAIGRMFGDMDAGFSSTPFEFTNDIAHMVRTFLEKFDAIFTLNQDLLLERHYFNVNIQLGNPGRWNGWEIVGVKPEPSSHSGFVAPGSYNPGIWLPSGNTKITESIQPYFKLHGSSNWRDDKDRLIMVMGTNKLGAIANHSVLRELHEQFREYLTSQTVCLMVIGYSFNDHHINEVLYDAAARGRMKLFIIDPLGAGVLDKNAGNAIHSVHRLVAELGPNVIRASRRNLPEIFGSDEVEFSKVISFFPPNWYPRMRSWPPGV